MVLKMLRDSSQAAVCGKAISGAFCHVKNVIYRQVRCFFIAIAFLWPAVLVADDDFDADLDGLIEREAYYGEAVNQAPKTIRLSIEEVSGKSGKINVLVFNDPDAFSTYDFGAAAGLAEVEAKRGSLNIDVLVKGVGPYAVFVHHDEDNDKVVDMSNGKPLEGVGYSGWIDPYRTPTFQEAAIVEDTGRIRLTYYRKDLRLRR